MQGWLSAHELESAPRLWQDIEIEAGWEDALEAVLRERLNAIGLDNLAQAAPWLGDLPPGKMTVYTAARRRRRVKPAPFGLEPLAAYVRCKNRPRRAALDDWLHQVYVVKRPHEGLALARTLPAGALLVSGDGHVFTRHSVSFHAPDSELHGVLSRQREIEQLTAQHDRRACAACARGAANSPTPKRVRAAQGDAQRVAPSQWVDAAVAHHIRARELQSVGAGAARNPASASRSPPSSRKSTPRPATSAPSTMRRRSTSSSSTICARTEGGRQASLPLTRRRRRRSNSRASSATGRRAAQEAAFH